MAVAAVEPFRFGTPFLFFFFSGCCLCFSEVSLRD